MVRTDKNRLNGTSRIKGARSIYLFNTDLLARRMAVHHDTRERAVALSSRIYDNFRSNPSRATIAEFLNRYRRKYPSAIRVVLGYLRASLIKECPKPPTGFHTLRIPDTRSEAYNLIMGEEEGRQMADYVLDQATAAGDKSPIINRPKN